MGQSLIAQGEGNQWSIINYQEEIIRPIINCLGESQGVNHNLLGGGSLCQSLMCGIYGTHVKFTWKCMESTWNCVESIWNPPGSV